MADQKISALTELTGANSATDDEFAVVDTSAVETKRMTRAEMAVALGLEGFTGEFDLTAITASKAVTAVAGFVYDTSLDSDGGAWRTGWRALASSWYWETLNTATRGARREFPAVAVIIAETGKVTIYDGDDPTLPMWMVFDITAGRMLRDVAAVSIKMLNGSMLGGFDTGSLHEINFLTDTGYWWTSTASWGGYFKGSIAQRNDNLNHQYLGTGSGLPAIVNATVNDVAITVLPNAPIDEATGLPTPTIAVATDGGVSVITDGGTVADIVSSSATYTYSYQVDFEDGRLLMSQGAVDVSHNQWVYGFNTVPQADTAITVNSKTGTGADVDVWYDLRATWGDLKLLSSDPLGDNVDAFCSVAVSTGAGLTILAEDTTTPANGMVAYLTSTYNTAWMQGDIKGCLLSSTTITSLVGTELAPDGDFATDVADRATFLTTYTDWSVPDTGYLISVTSGIVAIDRNGGGADGITVSLTTVIGETVILSCKVDARSHSISLFVDGSPDVVKIVDGSTPVGDTAFYVFTATATSYTMTIAPSGATSATLSVSNVQAFTASLDRSVNGFPLQVHGTITRAAVATGAELVAYSGFSAANYLEQPYNADLDFGTGDFYVMGWCNTINGQNGWWFTRGVPLGAETIGFRELSGVMTFKVGAVTLSGGDFPEGVWSNFVAMRSGGVISIYINGVLDSSVANTQDVTLADSHFYVAIKPALLNHFTGSLALLRIGAGAPSAAQIAKMYEDEKHLFVDNALATISADAVTALAVDPFTGLLEVGTAGDIDTVSGITPISRSTDNGATFISVADKLRISQ